MNNELLRELESAVIGICMLESDGIGRVYGTLESKNFYFTDHQKIFSVLVSMFDESKPIDLVTVWRELEAQGVELTEKNQGWLLTKITRNVVSSAHLEYHALLIREDWRTRELEKITMSGINPMLDAKEQASVLNAQISEIVAGEFKKDWYDMQELIFNLIVHQKNVDAGKANLITTGFKKIDSMNGGFWGGQMVVIGARPSMGKSALLGKIAVAMAKSGKKVGIISLEMNNTEIASRLAAIETDISFQNIFRNLFNDEAEQLRFHGIVSNQTINLPIYVSDKTKVDINEIKAKAQKLKHKNGCDCLILDYLQLVDSTNTNRNYNREQEVAKISRGLKLLAVEMDIPVIVACQLNRESTSRAFKDRHPRESDLRESGAIEQDADAVLMLHRDHKAGFETDDKGNSTEFEADLFGVKWRNGATFHLKLDFEPRTMKFKEINAIKTFMPSTSLPYSDGKEETPF